MKTKSRSEQIIVNLLSSGLAWGWPVLLSFCTTPLLVKFIGVDAYGIRGLTVSIIGYFTLLDMGANAAGTKYLAEFNAQNDRMRIRELCGTTLTMYTTVGIIGGIAIWFLAEWFSTTLFKIPQDLQKQSIWAFRIAGVGFTVSMITWWCSAIPTGLQRFDIFNSISIGFGTLTSLTSLLAAWLGYGIVGIVIANVVSNIVAVVAYIISIKKLLPDVPIRLSFEKDMFRRTASFSAYLIMFKFCAIINSQLDKTLIGIWIGSAALTFYIIPQSVAQIVHELNAKLMQIIFPMASEFFASSEQDKIKRLFYRSANLSIVIGAGLAIPIISCAYPLLSLWISPEFARESTAALIIMTVTFFISGLTAMPTALLGGIGNPKYIPMGAVISGVSSALLYLVLTKPFGINGAAWAKCISILLLMVFYSAICKIKVRISLIRYGKILFLPVFLSLLIGAATYWIAVPHIHRFWQLGAIALATTGVYFIVCLFSGIIDNAEKKALYAFISTVLPKKER